MGVIYLLNNQKYDGVENLPVIKINYLTTKIIEATKDFEEKLSFSSYLSKKLRSLYNEKNIEFDKLGVLDEVGLKRESLL
jgi:hypothetical protein